MFLCCWRRGNTEEFTEQSSSIAPLKSRTRSKRRRGRATATSTSPSTSSPRARNLIEQPKDDDSMIRLFNLIDTNITNHVINYYISSNKGPGSEKLSQVGKGRKEFEWARNATAAKLREEPTQVCVIRAIISYEVFKAIQDDFFIPSPERWAAKKRPTPTDQKQRLDYFHSLSTDEEYYRHQAAATEKLAKNILTLTQPLAASAGRTQEGLRLTSLRAIAKNAADFALTIGCQRPSFQIVFPEVRSESPKSGALRRSETSRTRGKNAQSDDTKIYVMVPELRKYGDERGENYEQSLTLVSVQELPELS